AAQRVLVEIGNLPARELDPADLDNAVALRCLTATHGQLRFQLRGFTRQAFVLALELADGLDGEVLAHLQGIDDSGQRGTLVLRPRDRAGAGDGLDATHAGRDPGLREDRAEADIAGGAHVGAAAQLEAETGHAHDAHLVAVLLAEQRPRAG